MKKQKIEVQGITISIEENDYINITDIAKQADKTGYKSKQEPRFIIRNWFQNQDSLLLIETWEKKFNPDFDVDASIAFRLSAVKKGFPATPQNYIEDTNAIGIKSKQGRYGGTFAHRYIALAFCYWLNPEFQLYFLHEFDRLKQKEALQLENTRTFYLSKITDYVDNARVMLDDIPGQLPKYQRNKEEEE